MSLSLRALGALETLQSFAGTLTLSKILSYSTKLGKVLVCILFLLNIRSWPLVWHFRVFRPVFRLRLQHKWLTIRGMFMSRHQKMLLEDRWLDSITPIGANPFTKVVSFKSWASLDDSDFNGHLSNSSYAKTLDSARIKAALDMFPMFFPTGGWIALAATHYHFIREIPILASYEVRTSVVAWDQKWLYIVSKFVCKPDGKKKKSIQKAPSSPSSENGAIHEQIMALRTPAMEDSSADSSTGTPSATNVSTPETEQALKAVAAGLAGEEADGAVLHTIVVSQLCYKVGRITVPPALVLGVNGFTGTPGHSHNAPHAQWAKAKEQMAKPRGGSMKKLKKLLLGGWREVPEEERWWDQALGEEVESRRKNNLALVEDLRKGLESVRSL